MNLHLNICKHMGSINGKHLNSESGMAIDKSYSEHR